MAPEIGLFALIVSLFMATAQSIVPLFGAFRNDVVMMSFGSYAAIGQAILLSTAFLCLTYAFVTSDFSVAVVAANSHTLKPLLYKVAGVWGNHEGSMLLWVLILSLFGAAVAVFGAMLPIRLRANALAVQGMIGTGFLAFIVFTSNPFGRLFPAPAEGDGLNPILQDPGLAFHPPFLYLGYVGFSMAFAFAVAALIEGKVDAAWARWVRPWVLAAWCFLTIGITLGSAWAYYTLGWGGWWFWDPVENASFMPWLAGTALLHSALVVERRNVLISWTLLLAILTFSLSLVGTFLVRSGVLTSVHAFAQDPARGVFILALIVAATGGSLTLYALRIPETKLKTGTVFAPVSREGALIFGNMILSAAAGTVFIGTFYPLIVDLIGTDKISVGPPYYNWTFVPIMLPLLVVMALAPMLNWKRGDLADAMQRLRRPLIAAGLVLLLILATTYGRSYLAAGAFAIAAWIVGATLTAFARRIRLGSASLETSLGLMRRTPRSVYGMVLAHSGIGIAVAGIAGMSAWATEKIAPMKVGDRLALSGYEVVLASVKTVPGPNYEAEQGTFRVQSGGGQPVELTSERRFYPVRQQSTTVAGIRTNLVSNIYVVLGEPNDNGAWGVRFYYHPFVPWIWIGALITALGGLVSLTDRRYRVGVPQGARTRAMPTARLAEDAPL